MREKEKRERRERGERGEREERERGERGEREGGERGERERERRERERESMIELCISHRSSCSSLHFLTVLLQLGFGKSMPTTCVWTDGIATTVTKKFLCRQFGRFGHVSHCVIDSERGRALIYYDNMELAQQAVNEMRGRALAGKKIQVSVL